MFLFCVLPTKWSFWISRFRNLSRAYLFLGFWDSLWLMAWAFRVVNISVLEYFWFPGFFLGLSFLAFSLFLFRACASVPHTYLPFLLHGFDPCRSKGFVLGFVAAVLLAAPEVITSYRSIAYIFRRLIFGTSVRFVGKIE